MNTQLRDGEHFFSGRERDAEAVSLHRRGYSYRRIASLLRWNSPSSVHKAVAREKAREPANDVEAVRRDESGKLDELERALWESLEALEPTEARARAAIANALLRCYERRARLYGIDGEWIDWDAALERAAEDAGLTEPEIVDAVEELMRAHAALKAEGRERDAEGRAGAF